MENQADQPLAQMGTDPVLVQSSKASNLIKKASPKIKTVSMFHEDECFMCHQAVSQQETPALVGCSFCPKSYHLSCLPAGTIITSPRWGCPAHKCATCGAPSSKSRGKMFRCVSCPTALCSVHVPKDCKVVPQNMLEERGYSSSSFHFIFCHKCEPAELDAKPGQKRTMSEAGLDIASILKRRKIGSNTMIKSPPDEQILVPMRGLFSSGFVYQKQVADEIGISQPLLSQYVHGATRNNGWRFLEEKLKIWLDNHTDLVARLESDAKTDLNSDSTSRVHATTVQHTPYIKQEPINHQKPNDFKIKLKLNLQTVPQPELEPKHQWDPQSYYIPVLNQYQMAAIPEDNPVLYGESPTFYGSDSSEIEAEDNSVWSIDIFQQHHRNHEPVYYY